MQTIGRWQLLQHQLKAPTQRDDKPVDMCCGGDRKAIVVVLTAGGPLGIKSIARGGSSLLSHYFSDA
jgi:hypothetical protein